MSSVFFQRNPYPSKWTETDQLLVEIFNGNSEYNDVKERFNETMHGYKIDKIERVQNKTIWSNYSRSLEEFKNKYKIVNESFVESTLFHGTKKNNPELIYGGETGLDIKYSANGSYGFGLYFAMNASYSAQGYSYKLPTGQFQFFLCRVILGNSVDNNSNIESGQDSIKGGGGSMFILKENHRSYPDYLITYSINNEQSNENKKGRNNSPGNSKRGRPKSTNANNNKSNNNIVDITNNNDHSNEDNELEMALLLSMTEQDDYDLALAIQLSTQDYNNDKSNTSSLNSNKNENENENKLTSTTTTTTTTTNTTTNINTDTHTNNNINDSGTLINFQNSEEYDDYELALALELSKTDSNNNSKKRITPDDLDLEYENNNKKKKQ